MKYFFALEESPLEIYRWDRDGRYYVWIREEQKWYFVNTANWRKLSRAKKVATTKTIKSLHEHIKDYIHGLRTDLLVKSSELTQFNIAKEQVDMLYNVPIASFKDCIIVYKKYEELNEITNRALRLERDIKLLGEST